MRSKDIWKFKLFWDDTKNAKNNANILKKHIFLDFFLKIYQNMGKKLGSNKEYHLYKCNDIHHWHNQRVDVLS
jgi:hypothetical protein